MASRWERLLDSKPIPILEHLLEEVSKLFAEDLSRWPLDVDDYTGASGAAIATLLRETPVRPRSAVWREAIRLARWDLEREFDAYDDYMRNERWRAKELTEKERALMVFFSQYMIEQLLGLKEATEDRVDRRGILDVLTRVERRLLPGLLV